MKTLPRIAAGLTLALSLGVAASAIAQTAPDSLKVTFCGTSGPLPVKDRAKPCVAIEAGGSLYLVDVGPESAENIALFKLPAANSKAVFITHLHSDHIGDLGEFNNNGWVAGRSVALTVVGPAGVDQLAAGINQAYARDHGFRIAHHEHDGVKLPLALGLLVPKVITLSGDQASGKVRSKVAWTDGGLTVTAIAVEHSPVSPAFGYRFDYKGRSVVISGDTKKWPQLGEAAKGADVLIHEAQNADMTKLVVRALAGNGQGRMSSIMNDTLTYHTTPVEAAELAKGAGVKALVLYHLTQAGLPFFTEAGFTKGMDAVGFDAWKLSKDGMTIELPVGSTEIKYGQD